MPRFSIIVPAFNAEATLGETLDAVLSQEYEDWECVVVDDGSTDQTLGLAERFASADGRFSVIVQQNQGSAGAYNAGVGGSTGDLIVLCSADDVLLPFHLSTMHAFVLKEAGYDIYSSNGYFWYPGSNESRVPFYSPGEMDEAVSLGLPDVIRRCFYSVGAVYRRELFALVGGYRVGVFGEDYDFWLRAMACGARHRYLPALLSLHRVSLGQKSASLERAFRSDIRLLLDLQRDYGLSAEARQAVRDTVRSRNQSLASLRREARRASTLGPLKRAAYRILGENRARALATKLRLINPKDGEPSPHS